MFIYMTFLPSSSGQHLVQPQQFEPSGQITVTTAWRLVALCPHAQAPPAMRGISLPTTGHRGNKGNNMGTLELRPQTYVKYSQKLSKVGGGLEKGVSKMFPKSHIGWSALQVEGYCSYHYCDNPSSFSLLFFNSRLCVAREGGIICGKQNFPLTVLLFVKSFHFASVVLEFDEQGHPDS